MDEATLLERTYRDIYENRFASSEEVIVRRRIIDTDIIDGSAAPRCSICYNDKYKQVEQHFCSECYGTTWSGGYHDPELVNALVKRDAKVTVKLNDGGYASVQTPMMTISTQPVVRERDLVWLVTADGTAIGDVDVEDVFEVMDVNRKYIRHVLDNEFKRVLYAQGVTLRKLQYEDPLRNIAIDGFTTINYDAIDKDEQVEY